MNYKRSGDRERVLCEVCEFVLVSLVSKGSCYEEDGVVAEELVVRRLLVDCGAGCGCSLGRPKSSRTKPIRWRKVFQRVHQPEESEGVRRAGLGPTALLLKCSLPKARSESSTSVRSTSFKRASISMSLFVVLLLKLAGRWS